VGIECYEGLAVTGDDDTDRATADALMARVQAVAAGGDAQGLFETDEVIVSAGGSALFDLVAARMRPTLSRPVRGVLRSGCYITHDHGHYRRLVHRWRSAAVVPTSCSRRSRCGPACRACPSPAWRC
jgi:D-serine dehydratase